MMIPISLILCGLGVIAGFSLGLLWATLRIAAIVDSFVEAGHDADIAAD